MTTREQIANLYRERDERILAAHRRGEKPERIALDEGLGAERVRQILRELLATQESSTPAAG